MQLTPSLPDSGLTANNAAAQDEFFRDLAQLTNTNSFSALFYIAAGFNSKLGVRELDESHGTMTGKYSRGRRYMNGAAVAQFLEAHSLFVFKPCSTQHSHITLHKSTPVLESVT